MPESVAVVGSANVDTIIRIARMPELGETVRGDGIERRPGGKGANQAFAAAAAGAPTRLIAAFGADQLGRAYRDALKEHQVDTTDSIIAPTTSGEAIITVDAGGENSIVIVAGANAALDPDTAVDLLGSPSWVLLQLEISPETVRAVIAAARERGAMVALNASPIIPEAAELARLCDLVIVNEHEASYLPDQPDLCVTRGSAAVTWGRETAVPPVVAVVDSTGAGDAFAGTLVAALAAGQTRARALAIAVQASSVVVQREGAQPWWF